MSISRHIMQQDGTCRACRAPLSRGSEAVKTPNRADGSAHHYFCYSCAREIAKVALADADLDVFGQELVMDKLNK
jgi:RNase P subunit RPR2